MRHILMVIIALLALNIFIPSIWAQSVAPLLITGNTTKTTTTNAPDVGITTTPTIAEFLNDSWVPSSFVPPTVPGPYPLMRQNATNSSYNIYDFLNNSWVPSSSNYEAAQNNNYAVSGLEGPASIYDVLNPSFTESAPINAVAPNSGYQMHKMG
jgi:hypothetical protein